MVKIYIIAGEASGDRLGAQAMQDLKVQLGAAEFHGIGGPMMKKAGLQSLFPMEELSVMGIFEILPKLFSLLKRIKQTVLDIEEKQPDLILTIDSPDFCFRVVKGVQKRGKCAAKTVHYVAPTVWAWREGRAKKLASLYDGLLCLLPFEPPYFEREGLPTLFVGHPVMRSGLLEADGNNFRKTVGIDKHTKTLGVFLGSRRGELKRLGPDIKNALLLLAKEEKAPTLIAPTLPHLKYQVSDTLKDYPGDVHVTDDSDDKWSAFKACDAAIAVSGTVGLELSIAGVPHMIAYKMNPLTWAIIKRVVKVRYAHLGNILLDEPVVPELIQFNCKEDMIADAAHQLLNDKNLRQRQMKKFEQIQMSVKPPENNQLAAFIQNLL